MIMNMNAIDGECSWRLIEKHKPAAKDGNDK